MDIKESIRRCLDEEWKAPQPKEKDLVAIAKKWLELNSLTTHKSGKDFREQAVWNIKAALEDAWKAGWMNGRAAALKK